MIRRSRNSLLLYLLAALLSLSIPATAQPASQYRIVGYYTSWSIYGQQYYVDDVPGDKLTHLLYAFANLSDTGECILGDEYADVQFAYFDDATDPRRDALGNPLAGNLAALLRLKERYPHLKTLLSVGGWTWSTKFTDAALTAESRERFVRSCVALMRRYGFDGLDIDWEFPVTQGEGYFQGRAEDKQNFTLLMAEFRRQLDQQAEADGRPYRLTIAAPQIAFFWENMELELIHPYLDWINIMTYSFHGGWAEVTNHHSALYPTTLNPDAATRDYNVDGAVRAYLEAGTPPEKLVIGIPFYGHGWANVPNVNYGLYQPFDGLTDGTWGCCGLYDYADLAANYIGVWPQLWDDEAKAMWLYDPAQQVMISYEDPQAIAAKSAYVRSGNLGGLMIWELSQDDDSHTLLNAIYTGLNP